MPFLRLDSEQRFSCSQCGRCCRRWDVFVSAAERDTYARRGVARWFRDSGSAAEGTAIDPFEPLSGWPGYYRIRARDDGSCGFLSGENRCRIHEELGAASKPLTCRMFPFTFHPVAGGAVVTASFGCPTIVANRGELVSSDAGRRELQDTYADVAAAFPVRRSAKREGGRRPTNQFVTGRSIDNASLHIIRESLLRMLSRADQGAIDLRANIRRIAHALDDLTRSRVRRLPDADFSEYIRLTLPYAANQPGSPKLTSEGGTPIGRLMQFGFLYLVCATRYGIEHRTASRFARRLAGLRLLAHFHGLAPGLDRVDVRALGHERIDINAPEIQPVAFHYLRAGIEAIGARERPVVDDFAIAVSCLNAACALAVMNARAAGMPVDREIFSEALMESVDVLQADGSAAMRWALPRLASGVDALYVLGGSG